MTNPTNIRYLSNHAGSAGTLVVTHSDVHLLIDFRYEESVRAVQASDAACPGLRTWPVPASYDEALIDMLSGLTMPAKLGIEAAPSDRARKEWLERTSTSRGLALTWTSTERVVEQPRLVKDASEIATLRDAAARLHRVAEAAFRSIRPGVTEREVAGGDRNGPASRRLRAAGLRHDRRVGAQCGAAALPRRRPRILKPGDLVVLDFGGVLDGYCSDLTRTVSVGAPTADALRLHAAVRDAQRAAIEAVRPGVPATSSMPRRAGCWIARARRGVRARHRSRSRAGRPRRTPRRPATVALSFRAARTGHGVHH